MTMCRIHFLLMLLLLLPMSSGVAAAADLSVRQDRESDQIGVYREGESQPIVVQVAREDFRPYLHPINSPDGKGTLTEYSPGHHRHQTGLYWGFTRLNGRDYFHHPEGDYWRRVSLKIDSATGPSVSWKTVYDLLDADGKAVLRETQQWTVRSQADHHVLDLSWQGKALVEIQVGQYDYGGLFLRMPWKTGLSGAAVNSAGQRNVEAEGQRAVWVDVGMQIEGRDDFGHVAILDHPDNSGFPLPWRVDGQLGVGPVRARLGSWEIDAGETETIRHRILVYTGDHDAERVMAAWKEYSGLGAPPGEQATASSEAGAEVNRLSLIVDAIASSNDERVRSALLQGLLEGLEGRRHVQAPSGWKDLSRELSGSKSDSIRHSVAELSQIFGDVAAIRTALSTLRDRTAPVAARRTAMRSLLTQRNEQASDLLAALLDEPELALDAIRGFAYVENAAAPALLLQRYAGLDDLQRRAVVETLATRKRYALALLDAVQSGRVAQEDVPPHVRRSLHGIVDDRFTEVFGELRPVAAEREQLIAKYKTMLTPAALEPADPSHGRVVFRKTCANCHLLYGEGGRIGPDLTGSNRANLDYILLNSVDPSYDVPDAYKTVTIVTTNGQVINGILAEEDSARIILKTVEEPRLVISKRDIEERIQSTKSMMPEGQFAALKPAELIDLVSYLRTTEQVELPQ